MLTMTKVLGEDAARERAKMEGTFKNMGYTERIKTVKTTGAGTTSKIVGADARAQAQAMGKPLKDAISTLGGDIGKTLVQDGNLSVDRLGKMTEEQYRKLVTDLRASDDNAAIVAARQLDNMRDLAKGATRPGDVLAQADAIGQLSKSGELAMQLAGASAILGNKGVSSMEGLDRAAFEQITSMSGENFDIMKRLDRELRGQFDTLQANLKTGKATDKEKKFAGMDYTEAVAAGLGREEVEKGMRGGFSAMEKMTDQMLTETQSITTTLKNYIGWTLEKIYKLIEVIAGLMPGGDDRAELLKQQEATMKKTEELNATQQGMAEEIQSLARREASFNLSGEDEARLATLRADYKKIDMEKAGLMGRQQAYDSSGSAAGAGVVADIAQHAAEVGAGGGGEAYQKEQQARTDAVLGALWDMTQSTMASSTTGGFTSLIPMGQGLSVWEQVPKLLDTMGALTGESTTSGIDQLTESTGLTEEYTGASKDTLAEMLSKDAGYFTASGKPLASLAVDQKLLLSQLLTSMKDTKKSDALETLAASSEEGKAAVAAFLTSGKKDALDIDAFTKSTDPSIMLALKTAKGTTGSPVDDFIYRGGASGGIITPINSADDFIGMKPGGNVERAGRGGTGGTVVVNINGDTATIVRVMKDVLQKSGLTASPNNGFA